MHLSLSLNLLLLFMFRSAFALPRRVLALAKATSARTMSLSSVTAKTVLVPIANGTEEIEAVTIIDTLVRGGIKVTTASVHGPDTLLQVTCSRGVKLVADCHISAATGPFDAIVLPGGMPGAEHLRDCVELTALLKQQQQGGRLVAAICAAPAVVLSAHGLLPAPSTAATCYPADKFKALVPYVDEKAVLQGGVLTSQGPGTAMHFALVLVHLLAGAEKGAAVAREMLTPAPVEAVQEGHAAATTFFR